MSPQVVVDGEVRTKRGKPHLSSATNC